MNDEIIESFEKVNSFRIIFEAFIKNTEIIDNRTFFDDKDIYDCTNNVYILKRNKEINVYEIVCNIIHGILIESRYDARWNERHYILNLYNDNDFDFEPITYRYEIDNKYIIGEKDIIINNDYFLDNNYFLKDIDLQKLINTFFLYPREYIDLIFKYKHDYSKNINITNIRYKKDYRASDMILLYHLKKINNINKITDKYMYYILINNLKNINDIINFFIQNNILDKKINDIALIDLINENIDNNYIIKNINKINLNIIKHRTKKELIYLMNNINDFGLKLKITNLIGEKND